MNSNLKFVFFGTSDFSVAILDILNKNNLRPNLIVTNPDRPKGRKLIITPPPVKVWAQKNGIECLQPEKLDNNTLEELKRENYDLFVVASYGSIIPKKILDIPCFGSVNIHTSLLPKFRGASPIESAILDSEKETGTTIIKMDEKMDHGDILAQESFELLKDMSAEELENRLANQGGELLIKTIQKLIKGKIKSIPQNHGKATFCGKIEKRDAELFDNDSEETKYRKYLAYYKWPKVFFFKNGKRLKVTKARFEKDKFIIERVIPEGKREMNFTH